MDKYKYIELQKEMDERNNSSPQKKEPTFRNGQLENAKSDETKEDTSEVLFSRFRRGKKSFNFVVIRGVQAIRLSFQVSVLHTYV